MHAAPHDPQPPHRPWPTAAKVAVGCGSGCALLVLLQALVIWGSIAVAFNARAPEGLVTRIDAPKKVTVGQKFPLTVSVANRGAETFRVQNLAVRAETLRRFRLENPDPEPVTSAALLGTQTWSYNKLVQPKDDLSVTFDAVALETGELEGTVEVQVNLAPRTVRFTVRAEAAQSP